MGNFNHSRWCFASGLCSVFKIHFTKVLFYFLKFYFSSYLLMVMYVKTKSVHFDVMTITVVMLGKFVCTFSYGKVKDIFWIRIRFHLGRTKGRGKRGYGGEAQN